MTPEVSVVVPTLNGMATLPALVRAVERQDDDAARELIVVDSGSTDGTREYASRVADRVVTVPRAGFNHGRTRNVGLAAARGRFVVLTVQDARPLDTAWLSRLLAPLRGSAHVAASFARQVPRPDAPAAVRLQLSTWVASSPRPRVATLAADEFDRLAPGARLERCAFDHVSAAVRREVWQRTPYDETPIAEDLIWARRVLLDGHAIAYVPDAVVEHSHDRRAGYEFARTWALHQQLARHFGLRAIPTVAALAGSIATTLRAHHRLERARGALIGSRSWRQAMWLAVAWPAGQFIGGWTEATGRSRWCPRGI